MIARTLVIAAASAAAIGISGCATTLPSSYHVTASGTTVVDCKLTPDCPVPMPHHWWFKLDFPDEIDVNVTPGQPVKVTWTIHGDDGTTFNPQGGISFKDSSGQSVFTCTPDASKVVYSCVGTIPDYGTYRYAIKTKGFWSGPDVDPVIKNGN